MNLPRVYSVKNRHRGAVLMVMLVILILGLSTALVGSLSSSALANARQEKTARALAQAREALIAYAISSENSGAPTARPGNFPCPDTIGNGNEQPSCSAAGGTSIGRLPWKSLGLPEFFDGEGEQLWYAVSDNFRKIEAAPLNSDTKGQLKVYDRDGTTDLTPDGSEAVAIVFAPGRNVGSQSRSTTQNAYCSTTSSTIPESRCAANYLESANGRNNATAAGPYIASDISDSFNDRLIVIRTRDFMPTIEKRVGKALKTILTNYQTANGAYPYPSDCDGASTCDSNVSTCSGRLPSSALPVDWTGSYTLPVTGSSNWFIDNKWYRVIYYTIGSPTCSPLDVSGTSADALFFMPGTPLSGVSRIYGNYDPALYLEDAENLNLDENYVTPTIISNDQIYVLP